MKTYRSSLAEDIIGLIEQKRACGYIYEYEAALLQSFDRFCIEQLHSANTITRELVMQWAVQRPTEGKNHRNQRVSFVRQLALYMHSLGKDVYVPKHFGSETVSVPHILSQLELTELYRVIDAYEPPQPAFHRFSVVYPVLFRLFYCCGLRLSEGCYLRCSCVDLDKGIIAILQSKGNKDRLVFLADDVRDMCREYDNTMRGIIPDLEWFFPGWDPDRPFLKTSIDKKFGEFWRQTSFAGKVDKEPTVGSLRHTFVVNKMNEWMETGVDTGAMMPYLSRYLGHTSVSQTQYYFHAIEQAFPAIRRRDSASQNVIPEVVTYEA